MRSLLILFACCAILPSVECFSLQASFVPAIRGSQSFPLRRPRLSVTKNFRSPGHALFALKSQSDSAVGGDAKLTDEMMLLMALKQLKQNELPEGSKVLVFGSMDRLGQLVVRTLDKDARFKTAVQVPKGMDTKKGLNYVVDGLEMGFPEATQICYGELPPDANAIIICVEDENLATNVDILKSVLSLGLPLKRVVLRSRIGVDGRDDWRARLNPFLKLDKWHAVEETVKEFADNYGFDYVLVRSGPLKGGPFYDTNKDFEQALQDRIFDAEASGLLLRTGDQPDADTGRDALAQCLVESVWRAEAANKVLSVTSCKIFNPEGVKCGENNRLGLPADRKGRPRQVVTPDRAGWDAAFANLKPHRQ